MYKFILVLLSLLIISCVTTDSGQGIKSIEEMSDSEFRIFTLKIETGIMTGLALSREMVDVPQQSILILADTLESLSETSYSGNPATALNSVMEFLGMIGVSNGLTENQTKALLGIAQFAILEIEERGGLSLVQVENKLYFSERSKAILIAVSNGLRT